MAVIEGLRFSARSGNREARFCRNPYVSTYNNERMVECTSKSAFRRVSFRCASLSKSPTGLAGGAGRLRDARLSSRTDVGTGIQEELGVGRTSKRVVGLSRRCASPSRSPAGRAGGVGRLTDARPSESTNIRTDIQRKRLVGRTASRVCRLSRP